MMIANTTTPTITIATRLVDRRADGKVPRRQPAVIAEEASPCAGANPKPSADGARERSPPVSMVTLLQTWRVAINLTAEPDQSPAAPLATLTWLLVDRQLTVGRMASNSTRSLCRLAVSMSTSIVASSSKWGLSPSAGNWVATAL